MKLALVTGATGLLGYHVFRALRATGCEVRALVRDVAAARWLEAEGAILVAGDVRDAHSLNNAMVAADTVFHCAAVIKSRAGWPAYMETNVIGTASVIEAAAKHGVRLVHASSVAVYGSGGRHRHDGELTAEDSPQAPLDQHEHYARSKRESENLVLDAHRTGKIWGCALRPDVLYGVHDRQFIPRAARLISGPIVPIVGEGNSRLPIVHAGNVADAMVLAGANDAAGGRVYNVANDFDITYREFVSLALRTIGGKGRVVHVPVAFARVIARSLELLAQTPLGAGLPLPARNSIDFLIRDNPFTSALARRELGWNPRFKPDEMVPQSFRWWMESRRIR